MYSGVWWVCVCASVFVVGLACGSSKKYEDELKAQKWLFPQTFSCTLEYPFHTIAFLPCVAQGDTAPQEVTLLLGQISQAAMDFSGHVEKFCWTMEAAYVQHCYRNYSTVSSNAAAVTQ